MHTITIYHNTACDTSRNTLALIRNSGSEPTGAGQFSPSPKLKFESRVWSETDPCPLVRQWVLS
jgi:hypothetical protein